MQMNEFPGRDQSDLLGQCVVHHLMRPKFVEQDRLIPSHDCSGALNEICPLVYPT